MDPATTGTCASVEEADAVLVEVDVAEGVDVPVDVDVDVGADALLGVLLAHADNVKLASSAAMPGAGNEALMVLLLVEQFIDADG
ncbi:MAG TPA: hypothetical protein VJ801_02760 [Polyangia bacterium]|jgi:hypothetical protein|nr:hypothetical protein [Polyangia bacterium]